MRTRRISRPRRILRPRRISRTRRIWPIPEPLEPLEVHGSPPVAEPPEVTSTATYRQTPLVLKASGPKPPPATEPHEITQPSEILDVTQPSGKKIFLKKKKKKKKKSVRDQGTEPPEVRDSAEPSAVLAPKAGDNAETRENPVTPGEVPGPQGAFDTHGWWAEQQEAAQQERARRKAAGEGKKPPPRRPAGRGRGAGLVSEQPPETAERGAIEGPDGNLRCPWGLSAPDYLAYHDQEWGRPVRGDTAIFERLCLEGFQSGLSWLTILRKRENFRAAFAGFDPQAVAAFGDQDVARLMADAGIVRNRLKVNAVITNARAALGLPDGLSTLVWKYAGLGRPRTAYAGRGAGGRRQPRRR